MKFVIGLGSVMYVDKDGHERFVPIHKTGDFDVVDTADAEYVELDMVGEEPTPSGLPLYKYWERVRRLINEA